MDGIDYRADPAPAIVCDRLHVVRAGHPALAEVSCALPAGTVIGLLGPNGSGKSTLMRCVLGVQRITSGRVTVLGYPAGSRILRGRVGYATQHPAVYPDLTVHEMLRYFATVLGVAKSDVDRVISQLDLADAAHVLTGRLSGGQRSRTNLAVALLGTPEVLVLDEPTVGADPQLREELWGRFDELARAGLTLLISSHVMSEAARCDRLLLLHRGTLLADTTPAQLLQRTGSDTLNKAFLSLCGRRSGVRCPAVDAVRRVPATT